MTTRAMTVLLGAGSVSLGLALALPSAALAAEGEDVPAVVAPVQDSLEAVMPVPQVVTESTTEPSLITTMLNHFERPKPEHTRALRKVRGAPASAVAPKARTVLAAPITRPVTRPAAVQAPVPAAVPVRIPAPTAASIPQQLAHTSDEPLIDLGSIVGKGSAVQLAPVTSLEQSSAFIDEHRESLLLGFGALGVVSAAYLLGTQAPRLRSHAS